MKEIGLSLINCIMVILMLGFPIWLSINQNNYHWLWLWCWVLVIKFNEIKQK